MRYSDLLSKYIEESGMTMADIAKKINQMGVKIERSYISMLKNNKTKNPASEEINLAIAEVTGGDKERLLMAAYLDRAPEKVRKAFYSMESVESFLDDFLVNSEIILDQEFISDQARDNGDFPLSELIKLMSFEEKLEILKVFVDDAASQKKTFDQYIKDINEINPELKTNIVPFDSGSMIRIPILGKIAAGTPIERIENIENYTLVEPYVLRSKDGFALEVKGDSMTGDRIYSGDLVVVAKQNEVTAQDIAVVVVDNDEVTLKRVRREGDMCLLIPSNPTMQPTLVPAEKVHIIGKVVEVKFWPK